MYVPRFEKRLMIFAPQKHARSTDLGENDWKTLRKTFQLLLRSEIQPFNLRMVWLLFLFKYTNRSYIGSRSWILVTYHDEDSLGRVFQFSESPRVR